MSEVKNLSLNGGIKYIPADSVGLQDSLVTGLYHLNVSNGKASKTSDVGSFTYSGEEALAVGDTVAIYAGTRPDERGVDTNDGDISYVTITAVDGTNYTYTTAEMDDVVFTPDILPVSNAYYDANGSADIPLTDMDYSGSTYAQLGLSAATTVDAGDFLAFYAGDLSTGEVAQYAVIDAVSSDGDNYSLTYANVTDAYVLSSMDLYSNHTEAIDLTDSQIVAIEQSIEQQAIDSGFADEAATYLANLAVQTDGFQHLSADMAAEDVSLAMSDDGKLSRSAQLLLADSGSKVNVTKKAVTASVSTDSSKMEHFKDKNGVRAELKLELTIEVTPKKDSENKIEISLEAVFAQEVLLDMNLSGKAIVKWALIFPYIDDYRINANFDVGSFTGIGVTATAKTTNGDDDDDDDKDGGGFTWKSVLAGDDDDKKDDNDADSSIINIGDQIKELMEQDGKFFGEDAEKEDDDDNDLAEKYADMIKNADDSWIEIVRKELFSQKGTIDPLCILAYGISADFVVSANLYVTIGMTLEFSTAKRYNFSLLLFARDCTSETVDLEETKFEFVFYVMGTIGVRAGIELEIAVGLFSTDLDSIGITAEVGAYAQLWGYFYYSLSWTAKDSWDSKYSGAMFIEVGIYLEITFKAQLANNDKLTYEPTLYENQWPLWSVGDNENVFDFVIKDDDDSLTYNIVAAESLTLPASLFDMKYMEMKSGKIYGEKDSDGNWKKEEDEDGNEDENGEELAAKNYDFDDDDKTPADADDEDYFYIESSNDRFTYDPLTDTIHINGTSTLAEDCELTVTWAGAPLAFTSKPISRTITIHWTNPANARYLQFDSKGGSAVAMISGAGGAEIEEWPANPTMQGYSFAGWYYADENGGEHTYTNRATIPAENTTVYAKWSPAPVRVKVEHYTQNLDGTYSLDNTAKMAVYTGSTATATPSSFYGFTYSAALSTPSGVALADGSLTLKLYYTRNTRTLTFFPDYSGAKNIVRTVAYGATISYPILAREGYTFTGWNDATETMQDADLNVGATWTINQYTIRFEENGGSTVSDVTQDYGSAVYAPSTPTRSGYTFGGWYMDNAFASPMVWDGAKMPCKNIILFAKWMVDTDYTVEHYQQALDGSYKLVSADTEHSTAPSGTVVKAAAKSYDGFTCDKTVEGTVASGKLAEGETLTLKLYYTRNRYDLTLKNNNDAADTLISYQYGQTLAAPTAPTKTDYAFTGWFTSDALTETFDFGTATMPIGGMTVYAGWRATSGAYTVQYLDTDGTVIKTVSLNGTIGETVTAEEIAITGYLKNGNTESNVPSGTVLEDGSLVLKLVYRRDSYTLSVVAYDNETYNNTVTYTYTYEYLSSFEYPTGVIPDQGYEFVGWYLDAARTQPNTSMVMPAHDLTIYAKWTKRSYTLTFDTDGGSNVDSITAVWGDTITLSTPVKDTYDFLYWNDNTGKTLTSTITMPNYDCTYTAIWKEQWADYTIEHYYQTAAGSSDYEIHAGETETYNGRVGATADTFTKMLEGYTSQEVTPVTILADGSAVVRNYYDIATN